MPVDNSTGFPTDAAGCAGGGEGSSCGGCHRGSNGEDGKGELHDDFYRR